MRRWLQALAIAGAVVAAQTGLAEPSLESGSVVEAAERLKPGEYLWAPQVAPEGPVLLVVNLATQRAVIYRNGLPIGITTISSGRPGYRTPTGVFTVLQRRVEHYSSLYNNAPMPYMQRLTWGGVALHAGDLPGYPASHGCIRLPLDFARLLYEVTHRGMTVVVTDQPAVPRIAPAEALLRSGTAHARAAAGESTWQPERSPSGPVSIVISAADRRAVVLRNGIAIGDSPIEIQGGITRTTAYVLSRADGDQRTWLRVALPGQSTEDPSDALHGRITVPDGFKEQVESVLVPGATVVVTADTLRSGSTGHSVTVIQDDSPEE